MDTLFVSIGADTDAAAASVEFQVPIIGSEQGVLVQEYSLWLGEVARSVLPSLPALGWSSSVATPLAVSTKAAVFVVPCRRTLFFFRGYVPRRDGTKWQSEALSTRQRLHGSPPLTGQRVEA